MDRNVQQVLLMRTTGRKNEMRSSVRVKMGLLPMMRFGYMDTVYGYYYCRKIERVVMGHIQYMCGMHALLL